MSDFVSQILRNLYIPNLGLGSLVELTDPLGMISSVQPCLLVRNFRGFGELQTPRLLSLRHGVRSDDACDL